MQDRHDSDLIESVMLGTPLQIIWVMQNMHDKFQNLPDPDIFAIHTEPSGTTKTGTTTDRRGPRS